MGLVMGTAWGWIIGYVVFVLASSVRAYETPVVLRDGRLAVLVNNEQLETQEGEKIEIPMGEHVSTYFTRLYASYLPPNDDKTSFYFGQDWESRIMAHIDEQSSSVWYAIQENAKEGSMFLQGFSYPDGKEVGYIGKKGFQETKPQGDDLFDLPTAYNSFLYMVSPTGIHSRQLSLNGLYQGYIQKTRGQQEGELVLAPWNQPLLRIDLRERTVVELLPGEKVCSVYPVSQYDPQFPFRSGNSITAADYRHSVIVRTDRDLVKFPVKDGTISKKGLLRVTIPEEIRSKHLGWHRFPDGSGLVFARGGLDSSKRNREYIFYRHDREGKTGSAERMQYLEETTQGWGEAGFVAIVPPSILVPSAMLLPGSDTREEMLVRQLLPISPAVGCLCGLVMVMHGRKRRLSRLELICWGVFGILFGLLGLMGFLWHRRWGIRVRCPSCGRDVLLRGEKCSGCAAEFPQPELVGTEVFA
jgi:hypothetical protein